MANVSALQAQYLSVKAQISEYQLQQTRYNNLRQGMSEKLSNQTKYAEKYDSNSEKAYDDAFDESKAVKYRGEEFKPSGVAYNAAQAERIAIKYANATVPQYNEELLDEYTALDIEYDLMASTYETLLTELEAQAESLKTALGNGAKDTGMIE